MSTDPTTEADVEALIRTTAHRGGVTAPEVQWNDSGPAMTRYGGRIIVLRRNMLRTADEARFVALHELGHVALGHQKPSSVFARVAVLIAASSLPLLASATLAPTMGVPWEISLFLGVLLGAALLALVARWIIQPMEYAADEWAARHGGHLTEDVGRAAYGTPSPRAQAVRSLWGTHPPTIRRVGRVQGLPDDRNRRT